MQANTEFIIEQRLHSLLVRKKNNCKKKRYLMHWTENEDFLLNLVKIKFFEQLFHGISEKLNNAVLIGLLLKVLKVHTN